MSEIFTEFRDWNWRHWLFYLGVPAVFSVYGSLNNWHLLTYAGFAGDFGFYAAHAFLPWLITCLACWGVMQGLARWKPHPLVIMLTGHTISCMVVVPWNDIVIDYFAQTWPSAEVERLRTGYFTADFWMYWFRAGFVWVTVNLFFDRFVGLPRYWYTVPKGYDYHLTAAESRKAPSTGPEETTDRPLPAFVARLEADLTTDDVLAIRAEQHYIRVITAEKNYMVLYRFSDAVGDLDGEDGLQVHRSWWIRKSAVERIRQGAKKVIAVLSTGEEVPVSRPYQGLIKEHAKTEGLPVGAITSAG